MVTRFIRYKVLVIMFASVVAWPASAQETTAAADRAGMPRYGNAQSDDALARANRQVDRAEHDYALARHMTPTDRSRIAFYGRDLQVAHRQLTDLLRQRQTQPVLTASAANPE